MIHTLMGLNNPWINGIKMDNYERNNNSLRYTRLKNLLFFLRQTIELFEASGEATELWAKLENLVGYFSTLLKSITEVITQNFR